VDMGKQDKFVAREGLEAGTLSLRGRGPMG